MSSIIDYIDESPIKAVVYLLMVGVVSLSGVVVYLFKDKQKQEVKNFDMLIRSIEALKDNAVQFELSKEQSKDVKKALDLLLRKYG